MERLSTLLLENQVFGPRTPSEAQECLNQIESAVVTGSESVKRNRMKRSWVLIQEIQLLPLERGKTVAADRIRELFSQLLDTVCL